jgi:PhnB protein
MKPNPIPDGYRSITPYLKLPNCGRLIEFLKQAFGGVEKARLAKPDGAVLHAEIVIGDSLLMVHEAPDGWRLKPASLYHCVADVDAAYEKAIAAGATSVFEPADMYYGARVACVTDVADNDWWLAQRVEELTLEEIQRRAIQFVKERTKQADSH